MRIGKLLGLLVLVLAGCSATHHDPTSGVRLVPWDGSVPAAVQPAPAASAPRRQQQEQLPAESAAFPSVTPPDSALLAVPPGAAVSLDIDWRNWCVPQTSRTPVPPKAIRLTLPGGAGKIDARYNAVPSCDTPGAATTVGVHPFQPAPLSATKPWTSTVV